MKKGIVYLLGAGPGDPGLLTIKAKNILERADVIIYDYLANKRFLSYCRLDAELIYVGKMGGDHTLPQDQINALIITKAKQGLSVARLKGGDPYMFGRGAEEAEELLEAGLSFEVVPGVTSAIAAPAYAGIPLTHRKYASSVSFITGHEDPKKSETSHNWHALATGTSTLCFFMGVKNLENITTKLVEHGMSQDMPAALIRWGTTPIQQSWFATVGTILELARKEKISAPAMLVVGQVVLLHKELNWFEAKPLYGKGVVVTRARQQASELLESLEDLGARCFECPTIKTVPIQDKTLITKIIKNIDNYHWIIFTSVNGVDYFFNYLYKNGVDSRIFAHARFVAVGSATFESLKKFGILADLVPKEYIAESIISEFANYDLKNANILIPRAKIARDILPESLSKIAKSVDILPVYENEIDESEYEEILTGLENKEIQYITFTSSSTVENFFTKIEPDVFQKYRKDIALIVIGPVTAKTLEKIGFKADIMPNQYTIPALINALILHAQGES